MTLGIYSNARPMATLETKRRLGEPLRVLLLANSFTDDLRELWSGDRTLACGLFVPAKRCAGWANPFHERFKVRICCGTCGI
jgi:hypothetical protein